ncbi:NCS2 family permease [Niallia oryzisoli]|uniref:NCS2 family permease n=1 Tax=Niallia oryzisoli TaxID=1737571 RepID=A0ABZ2CF43_9BACI
MKEYFQFVSRKTNYRQETIAGFTTFLSMAYILVVNPIILSQSGTDKGAVFTATALSAIIGSLLIGIIANYPIGIAPSMGLNSFLTFSVCIGMIIPWQTALTGVFVSGILFIILSLLKIREKIINIIPKDLKHAIVAGIGFFIAFIGLKNGGLIVANEATFVSIGDLKSTIVGALMSMEVKQIEWNHIEIAIPAFITILMMPLTYSVATGIALGFILYPITKIALGRGREIHPIMYGLCVAFICYFVYLV